MSKKQKSQPMNIVPMYQVPLRDALDRLFDGSFLLSSPLFSRGAVPAADLSETDTVVTVRMAVPGADAGNIQVSATENTLTVSGEVKREYRSEKEQPHLEEIMHGTFRRSLTLPTEVDPMGAHATYQQGILTVTLPRAAESTAHPIPVVPAEGRQEQSSNGADQQETVPVTSGGPG